MPRTRKELIEEIELLKKQLDKLEDEKSPASAEPISETNGLEYLKATDDLKERIRLKGLIRKYEYMLRNISYEQGTEPFVQDLTISSQLPEFSWGIDEKGKEERAVLFEQKDSNQEYIKVTNYGLFRYLTGESGVHIENIPNVDKVKIYVDHFLKYGDKVRLASHDIEEAIINHPEYIGEKLNFLRITKGVGNDQRDYFVLSPVRIDQLQDDTIKRFFINEYCSDVYLQSVATGKNGIYAGDVHKSDDGHCTIRYKKSSVRAAKLAEMLKGSTQLQIQDLNGKKLSIPGATETFKQMRDRFYAEIFMEQQTEAIKKFIEGVKPEEWQK